MWWWWWAAVVVVGIVGAGGEEEVKYDGRSLILDGQRKILFSGSIHYPRSTPQVILITFLVTVKEYAFRCCLLQMK